MCGTGRRAPSSTPCALAASVARYALDQDHHVQLALCGTKFELIGPLHGRGDLEEVLRVLALAQATGEQPFAAWLPRVLAAAPEELDPGRGLHRGDGATRTRLGFPTAGACLIVPVVVDAASFMPSASRARVRGAAPRGAASGACAWARTRSGLPGDEDARLLPAARAAWYALQLVTIVAIALERVRPAMQVRLHRRLGCAVARPRSPSATGGAARPRR